VEARLRLLDRAEDEALALAAAVRAERPATAALANVRSRRAQPG
jgi:hypothetical protein